MQDSNVTASVSGSRQVTAPGVAALSVPVGLITTVLAQLGLLRKDLDYHLMRTEATDETQGFMKVLVADDDRILGFSMLGSETGEVMAAVQMATLAKAPYPMVGDAVIAHLTFTEGLGPLLSNVEQRIAK